MCIEKGFVCQRCGECCGIVPFSKSEYKKIRNIAKKMHVTFIKDYLGGKVVYFPKKPYEIWCNKIFGKIDTFDINFNNHEHGLYCPFLEYDDNNKASCKIYELRPKTCRDFGNGTHEFLTCPKNKHMYFKRITNKE